MSIVEQFAGKKGKQMAVTSIRDLGADPALAMTRHGPPEPAMSETYAKALHEYEELRARLADMTALNNDMAAKCTVLARENERVHARIEQVEEQRDTYKRRVWEMESRMDDLASIAMRIIDTRMSPKIDTTNHNVDVDAIAAELVNTQPPTEPQTPDPG